MSSPTGPRGGPPPLADTPVEEPPGALASNAELTPELEAIAAASGPRGAAPGSPPSVAALPLGLARAARLVDEGVEVETPGGPALASIDGSVAREVIATACERREMLLVAIGPAGAMTVVGALRTQPTPGVDAMDTIRLEARRVELVGGDEVQIRSAAATLAVRAVGEIESYADRIVSRAEEVQKIIGRMLRLN